MAALLCVTGSVPVCAQTVLTQVYTDYHGFWSTSTASANTIKPDSSHNLLAFTYNGVTYATGVNNTLLTNNSVSYQSGNYQAFQLPANSLSGAGNAVIGVGNLYGGGPGNVSPLPVTNNLAQYLSDGIQGLDLGTAVFNIPHSDVNYPVNSFNTSAISDNIPDIIVTQVGQPPAAGSSDSFRFENSAGDVVGHAVAISLAGIDTLGVGYWKFYNPGPTPTYNSGLQGDRPLRMVAFRLADFGLTAANAGSIVRFVHTLSGNSDQAFIAYNTAAFSAGTGVVLPVTLTSFEAVARDNAALLSWTATNAQQFSHFELERKDAATGKFAVVAKIPFTDASAEGRYAYEDMSPAEGKNYYRLKLVDLDGAFSYSVTRMLDFSAAAAVASYPNPVHEVLYVHLPGTGGEIAMYDAAGRKVEVKISGTGTSRSIGVRQLAAGLYTLHVTSGGTTTVKQVLVQH